MTASFGVSLIGKTLTVYVEDTEDAIWDRIESDLPMLADEIEQAVQEGGFVVDEARAMGILHEVLTLGFALGTIHSKPPAEQDS